MCQSSSSSSSSVQQFRQWWGVGERGPPTTRAHARCTPSLGPFPLSGERRAAHVQRLHRVLTPTQRGRSGEEVPWVRTEFSAAGLIRGESNHRISSSPVLPTTDRAPPGWYATGGQVRRKAPTQFANGIAILRPTCRIPICMISVNIAEVCSPFSLFALRAERECPQ